MNEKNKIGISKFLSLILRHKPQTVGLQLDENGWADVDELLAKCTAHRHPFSKDELEEVVATNDKQRFAFNADKTKIRASQGHSVDVDLNLDAVVPPEFLYHGTVARFLAAIKNEGLKKINRQHVHLSKDTETAQKVGNRRGEAMILNIRSEEMHRDGHLFYLSANGVWLTDSVPARYLYF